MIPTWSFIRSLNALRTMQHGYPKIRPSIWLRGDPVRGKGTDVRMGEA